MALRPTETGGDSEDAVLLQQVADGDGVACRLLSQRYLGRIVTFARRMLNDPVEAEDVAQEAFFKLWSVAGRWQPNAKINTWLHQVAHNLCIDRLRKNRDSLPGDLPETRDEAPSPLELRHRQQVSQVVEQALGQLPERQRTAITLVYYQEMSGQEAAMIMAISVEALESLLMRGRKGLRQKLNTQRMDLLAGDP